MNLKIQHFFDNGTSTLSYIVWDADTLDAVIIDPVLDFDPANLKFSEDSIGDLLSFVESNHLNVHHVLETHIHADHITGASRLREKIGARLVVGSLLPQIQETFVELLGLDGSEINADIFDVLMADNDVLQSGSPQSRPFIRRVILLRALRIRLKMPSLLVIRSLCQTLAQVAVIFQMVQPKRSTIRSKDSMNSQMRLVYSLHMIINQKRCKMAFETTIGACKSGNKQLKAETPKADFLKFRTERDAQLNLPKLIFQSVQLNIRAGALPQSESNGMRLMRIPLLGE